MNTEINDDRLLDARDIAEEIAAGKSVEADLFHGMGELEFLRYLEQRVQTLQHDYSHDYKYLVTDTLVQLKLRLNERIIALLEARNAQT